MRTLSIIAISLSVSFSASAFAEDWYVDDTGPGGNGHSWNTAKTSLNDVLVNFAEDGDTIFVGQGTYTPGSERTDSFVLERVQLLGGYAGYGAGDPYDNDPATYVTVLSGEIGSAGYSNNSYHVVTASDSGMDPIDTLVFGFTITLGNGNGNTVNAGGGGIKITSGASPRFDRCIITANRVAGDQGPFDEEQLGFDVPYGAGIKSSESSPVFTRCTISSNQANDDALIYGGGIVVQGAPQGTEGPVRLIDCSISGNRAAHGGGVAVKSSGEVTLVNCLITGNTISTFSNATPWGGGIGADKNGTSTIINCTISGNTAVKGGGLAQWDDETNDMTIHSSIVWGNIATGEGPEIYADDDGGPIFIDYSDIRDRGSNGSGVVDPSTNITYGSGVIGENTSTHDPDFTGGGNYHLECTSPCIGTGHPTTTIIPSDEFDLGGVPGTSDATPDLDLLRRIVGTVDMGVYEHQSFTCVGDADHDCDVDTDDLVLVILHWDCLSGPPCIGDVNNACGSGTVDADDIVVVILHWGACPNCTAIDEGAGASVDSYEDCVDLCSSLEGEAAILCMQACFAELCAKGHTAFCD